MRQTLDAKARNAERHRVEYEEHNRKERLRRIERARESKKRAERDVAYAKNGYDKGGEKRQAKAIARAEAGLRRAERELDAALVAAGMLPESPAVVAAEPVVAVDDGPDDGELYDDTAADEAVEEPVTDVAEESVDEVEDEDKEPREIDAEIYTVEMEKTRYDVLSKRQEFSWSTRNNALHGDAFCVEFKGQGVNFLFLNPPYDTEKVHGRTEQRFLLRFTDALATGGILVFVVPYYALSASVYTLATRYEDVACYRFAGSGFDVYSQVVVFAKKLATDRFEPDEEIFTRVVQWSKEGASLPELPIGNHRRPKYVVPMHSDRHSAFDSWEMKALDVAALLEKFEPWSETTRRSGVVPLSRVVPTFSLVDCMHRVYEVATPPRPAHIAAGLAAGLFNGQKISPDDPGSKLPDLLMKGVFDREWKTIEEKKDKHGEVKSVVQVQAPKLVITVLDLREHVYHTLGATLDESGSSAVSGMGIMDILRNYGKSLVSVMEKQCKVLYDPRYDADSVVVADSPRTMFKAQAHCTKAMIRFAKENPGDYPLLAAEIGSGKSTMSLMTAKTQGAKHILVLCPPHLLDSWRNEARAVVPEYEYRVLDSITAVNALPKDKSFVAVLSRETAKLSHRLEGISGRCPGCGSVIGVSAEESAKKRLRCEHRQVMPGNSLARLALALAMQLRQFVDAEQYLPQHVRPGYVSRRRAAFGRVVSEDVPTYSGLPSSLLHDIREALVETAKKGVYENPARKALALAMVSSDPSPDVILDVVAKLRPEHNDYSHFAESLLLLLPSSGGALGMAFELLSTFPKPSYNGMSATDWFKQQLANTEEGNVGGLHFDKENRTLAGHGFGSVQIAANLLKTIASQGVWKRGKPCGEPLYQSVPEPRRYPLAKYIVRKHKDTFDFVIVDEMQEYANDTSAQTIAAHRLVALRKPMVFMTGTVMNGYAKSIFPTMQAISADFRKEFDRDDLSAFVDRYGYRKRILADKVDGEVVAYGSQSDRVERSERDAGDAPGIHPMFIFRYLLRSAVTLHKADLRLDLPVLTQDRAIIQATPQVFAEYTRMLEALKKEIKAGQYHPGLAGKLFGQLGQLGSYLDCCTEDVGNIDGGGSFEVRYPDNMLEESYSNRLVVAGEMFPASTILPKEAAMLRFVETEIASGRNVMVMGWHIRLLPRLARLIQERIGEAVPVLYAEKVPSGKRQAWIEKEIVGKKRKVMVVNPVCVQTGLNSLVHFSSEWWHEDPACNPLVFRQAVGRIDRIGAKLPTKTLFGYYGETLQEKVYDLLMAKVGISTAVDGLDPTAAWAAAGIVEDEHLLGLSLGKALWDMMSKEEENGGSNVVPIRRVGGNR